MSYSDEETRVIGECLRAAAEGPFFDDEEYHALFGLTREEVARVATQWPHVSMEDETVQLAVANAMVNLVGYPHGEEAAWSRYISVPRDEVDRIASKSKSSQTT
jgi:hypothetical protein